MKLLLTSFGVNTKDEANEDASLFARMPPIAMRNTNRRPAGFMPDFAALLLCDRIIMDEVSFARLTQRPHLMYRQVAETMKSLQADGFVELADFEQILADNEALLDRMIKADFEGLERWLAPLEESIHIWRQFVEPMLEPGQVTLSMMSRGWREPLSAEAEEWGRFLDSGGEEFHRVGAFLMHPTISWGRAEGPTLKELVRSYLSYVNANIVLSAHFGVGFYDWADFAPLYRRKFLSVGRQHLKGEQQIEKLDELFSVSFPHLAIDDSRGLMRALHDGRVADLRQLVDKAVEEGIQFDVEFANRVLLDVLGAERRSARFRRIVSYLTIPLGLLGFLEPAGGLLAPTVASEIAGKAIDDRVRRQHRWFYMLSDIAEERRS